MALTVTHVAAGGGNYGASSNQATLTMPSWSVTSGDLLVVAVGACGANNAPGAANWSLTGGGLTWTKRAEANTNATFLANCAIFTAVATSTTSITNLVPVHVSGLQTMYATWAVSGFDTTTPVPATAALADSTTDGQKDITLSATPASTSVVLAVCFVNADDNNATKKIDHGASDGWTEDFDYSPSMSGTNMWGQWNGQRKTSPSLTRVRWDDIKPATVTATTYSFSACAIEIKAAAGGGTSYTLASTGTGASTGSLAVASTMVASATGTGTSTGSLAVTAPTTLAATGTGATTGTLAVTANRALSANGTGTSTGTLAVTITSGPALLTLAATGHSTTTGHLAVTGSGDPPSAAMLNRNGRGGYQPRNTPAERRAFFDHKRQLAKLQARIEALEP